MLVAAGLSLRSLPTDRCMRIFRKLLMVNG